MEVLGDGQNFPENDLQSELSQAKGSPFDRFQVRIVRYTRRRRELAGIGRWQGVLGSGEV